MSDQDQVTFVETDIDCLQCLDDVRTAVARKPWVDEIEVDASAGCLVVRHHGEADELSELVGQWGHRLSTASNGEVLMDRAEVDLPTVCPVGHDMAAGGWH